jgi:hypothetical protein
LISYRPNNSILSFPGTDETSLAEVGGKGYSLIRMAEAGLHVPPGAVLTTAFFAPWFNEIQASATWTALADTTPDQWATLCNYQEKIEAYEATFTEELDYSRNSGGRREIGRLSGLTSSCPCSRYPTMVEEARARPLVALKSGERPSVIDTTVEDGF